MREAALPSPKGRDLRLDLLRGLCVARMLLVHLGWSSAWIRWPFGLVTAAEGFFLISGVTLGKVGWRYALNGRAGQLDRRLLRRAAWLWLANTILVIVFRKLDGTCASPSGALAGFWGSTPRWQQILGFDQPSVLHVLPRYVVFLLGAPLVLWALRRERGALVALASVGLWAVFWQPDPGPFLPWLESPRAGFPVAAWQLLFVGGMVLGFLTAQHEVKWSIPPWLFGSALIVCVGFVIFDRFWLDQLVAADLDRAFQLFGREPLAPGRLVNLAALALVLWVLVDRYERQIVKVAGWLLLPLGQRALAAFLLHVPMVWLLSCLTPRLPFWTVGLLSWTVLVLVSLVVRSNLAQRLLAPV